MSNTHRDKDYHKLRNSKKYFGDWHGDYHIMFYGERTQEDAEGEKGYKKIHAKYGFKSMVGNKRRRNTTRKSNQKTKQMMHQIERAKLKQETLNLISTSII